MAPTLSFSVRRRSPELVGPARPTPREIKRLSDIDDQESLRFHIPGILFYGHDPAMAGRDPAGVIKDAVAKALVFYYPFAGRIREGPARKLFVECTGEGVLFIEADADVKLEEFGDELKPPFPGLEELLYDVEGSGGVLDCPLILIQVTRLLCGGFILAIRHNHTMADAQGMILFMKAVAEMACGAASPSVPPVWSRDRLEARSPPRPSFPHREYDQVPDTKGNIVPLDDMAHRSFLFTPREISALRGHLRTRSSAFEVLAACLWKCRTLALQCDPEEIVRLICIVSARAKFNPPLPSGYYGNAFAFPVALSESGKLCENPLAYAVDLVKKAKREVDEEYMRSVADRMALDGRPHFSVVRTYLVSDVTRAGFGEVDFGWGPPVYGGPAKGGVGAIPGVASFFIPYKNAEGEAGIMVPICLPGPAMERFTEEMERMVKEAPAEGDASPEFIASAH